MGSPETDQLETDFTVSYIRMEPTSSPQKFDVLLGRGRAHVENPGNQRLQIIVNINKPRYAASNSHHKKTQISQDIVHQIKNCGTETGRFLRYDKQMRSWIEVDDQSARRKVSQALRYHGQPLKQKSSTGKSKQGASSDTAFKPRTCLYFDAKQGKSDSEEDHEPIVSDEDILDALGWDQSQYSGYSSGSQT